MTPYDGHLLDSLDNLVSKHLPHAATGPEPSHTPQASPAPLCSCGEEATTTYEKEPVCADCYEGLKTVESMSWAEYYGYDVR